MTSNNTIEGTQWKTLPTAGDSPLVSDASSDIFSGPIDVAKYGVIYAGAQKNLGPSGVTLVIIREDLLARSSKSLHTMLNYAVHAENGSLYNTPPAFGIYVLGLVVDWLRAQGGLDGDGGNQQPQSRQAVRGTRSDRLLETDCPEGQPQPDERDLPARQRGTREGVRQGIDRRGADGLKGHRSVGGMRASIYNAFPESGVDTLVEFMREFERRNG